jgi:hypothetical protein
MVLLAHPIMEAISMVFAHAPDSLNLWADHDGHHC